MQGEGGKMQEAYIIFRLCRLNVGGVNFDTEEIEHVVKKVKMWRVEIAKFLKKMACVA